MEPVRNVNKFGCSQVFWILLFFIATLFFYFFNFILFFCCPLINHQILWLFGPDHQITEVGAMNIFFLIRKATGGVELVTAPLTRGDILEGVTRSSILDIARSWSVGSGPLHDIYGDVEVNERWLTMGEVVQARNENRVRTLFVARRVFYVLEASSCSSFCFLFLIALAISFAVYSLVARSLWSWNCCGNQPSQKYSVQGK